MYSSLSETREVVRRIIGAKKTSFVELSLIAGIDIHKDLQGVDLRGVDLHGISLEKADLRWTVLDNANLRTCIATGANLRGASLRDANLEGAILDNCILENVDLTGANLRGASLRDANLEGAILDNCILENVDLTGANLIGLRKTITASTYQRTHIGSVPHKHIVKKLARGMQLKGKVTRVTKFGAFVDIGVNTVGLVHISELAPYRVAEVTDVVNVGDEVTVWIKDLNKAKNRISLTMIPPERKTIRDLHVGEIVKGRVTQLKPYGAFVDIGIGKTALLHVREMAEGYVRHPEDLISVGDEIEAKIIQVDVRCNRVNLSIRGLHQKALKIETIEDAAMQEEEGEVLSLFKLAFMETQERQRPRRRRKRPKKR